MVVALNIQHVFQYPVNNVVDTHFTKYPTDKEKAVLRIEILDHEIDLKKGIDYKRRLAVCENVIPQILRQIPMLNEKNLLMEEQSWVDMTSGGARLRSRNITWSSYINMWEESTFRPLKEKKEWTKFVQHGVIEVQGLGSFGRILELFGKQYMRHKMQQSIQVMEEILKERYPPPPVKFTRKKKSKTNEKHVHSHNQGIRPASGKE